MSALGLTPDDLEESLVEVWPENWAAVEVFEALSTQWRTGPMGGVIGLDYAAIPAVLRLMDVPRDQWRVLFTDLREMESEALAVMRPAK